MTTICKTDIINAVAEGMNVTKGVAENFLEVFTNKVNTELLAGNEVILTGIGRLKPVERAARSAWNVHTQSMAHYPAKRVIKFSATQGLKDAMAESA